MRWVAACPAKINLFLAVGPRDERGYHPLRTVFQAIDLEDELVVERASGAGRLHVEGGDVPAENTLTRTLRLLGELVELPPLAITLRKRIPAESGLGGGSSDAAALIRIIPRLIGADLPAHELQSVASAVGADVPFFLVGGRARAEHYGEVLTPLPDPEPQFYVLLRPAIGSPTPTAFAKLDELAYAWRDFPESDELYNDFERVAARESLEGIGRILELGAIDAGMTGSGSAVFGRFATEAAAKGCFASVCAAGNVQTWLARPLTRSESIRIREDS